MSDYVKTTNFAAKDSLPSGNAGKIVKGTEINTEFDNIATAVATKENAANKGAAGGYVGLDGSSNISAAGSITGASFIPTGSSVPANGVYLPSANTVGVASNTTLRASVNSTGNWVLAAPSSGTTVTATGASAQNVYSATVSGNGAALAFNNGTATGYAGSYFGNVVYFGASSAHAAGIVTSGLSRIDIASSGNVTINAPTSGVAIAVTGVAGGTSQSWTDGTRGAAIAHSAGIVQIGSTTADSFGLYTNNSNRLTITSAGSVAINPPTSGTALTVNGLAGQIGLQVSGDYQGNWPIEVTSTGGATTGRVAISFVRQGGTNKQWAIGNNPDGASDNAFGIRDITRGAVPLQISTNGNVTVNAPSSGTALVVAAAAAGVAQQWTKASAATVGVQQDASNGYVGTDTAHGLGLYTNGTTRVTIAAASGAVTFTGGLSGITTLAMTGALSGATTGAFSAGLTCTTLGMSGALTGATTGSFSGAVATGALTVTGTIAASGTISQGGTLIDDNGSFTGTLTGCTTAPTGTINWARSGKIVVLSFPAITATSNTLAMGITGLPSGLFPSALRDGLLARVMNNGSIAVGYAIVDTLGNLTFSPDAFGNNFTNSGTKGIQACSVTYFL